MNSVNTNDSRPPVDRFCDLVLKGGITSGVVYPRAINLLSKYYHFRGIGGTSAGAIAAAITAAAEYQRRQHDGCDKGFELLKNLPEELGNPPKKRKWFQKKRSKLLSLFQPQRPTRRLFSVLVSTLNRSSTGGRWLSVFAGLLAAYWPATLLMIAIAWITATLSGAWFVAFLLLLITLPLAIGTWVYLDITRDVVANGYGLCSGMSVEKDIEALTPWLHRMIQEAAGRDVNDKPLTFGDLWEAKGFPPDWIQPVKGTPDERSIDLQIFATNLTHGRPYVFPLMESETEESRFKKSGALYFDEIEIRQFFPDAIVRFLKKESPSLQNENLAPISLPDGKTLLQLPEPKDFPILLAVRMSLAFPFLISAIPLYAEDNSLTGERTDEGKPDYRRCWFSDGGICSNFPIHLFDDLVPAWPTFGIHLEPRVKKERDTTYLPQRYSEGYGESWSLFGEKLASVSQFGGFISAMANTMQNWNDNTVRLMPGFRDRVVRVRLEDGEGGMNLNMEPEIIESLALRGEEAAQKLIDRFAAQSLNGDQAMGWNEHRFVRLSNLIKMIKARAPQLKETLSDNCKHATRINDLLEKIGQDENGNAISPPGYEELMTPKEKEAYREIIKALNDLASAMDNSDYEIPFKPIPKPEPELRIRPPL